MPKQEDGTYVVPKPIKGKKQPWYTYAGIAIFILVVFLLAN